VICDLLDKSVIRGYTQWRVFYHIYKKPTITFIANGAYQLMTINDTLTLATV